MSDRRGQTTMQAAILKSLIAAAATLTAALAHAQPAEVQSDLLQWADFLSGIAEMQDKANSTD